jgi:hypothetical protein
LRFQIQFSLCRYTEAQAAAVAEAVAVAEAAAQAAAVAAAAVPAPFTAAGPALSEQDQCYQTAYETARSNRRRQRRVEAEQWASTQTSVVASSIDDVYYWLNGGPRSGDSGIVYNRRNKPNGLGDGGQVLMHMVRPLHSCRMQSTHTILVALVRAW